jgi:hypothetical protein
VKQLFGDGVSLVNTIAGTTNYNVTDKAIKSKTLAAVFRAMEEEKDANGILDWGISDTTMEEVFTKITRYAIVSLFFLLCLPSTNTTTGPRSRPPTRGRRRREGR